MVLFVRREEVAAIANERTADRATHPLLVERQVLRSKRIPGIQRVVAAEVETSTAQPVGARAGSDRDDGVQGMAVFRIELVPKHLEFLHGLLADVNRRAPPHGVVDLAAVNERCVTGALIGDAAEFRPGEPGDGAVDRTRSGQELRQHQEIAVEYRQRVDVPFGHDRGRLRSRNFHERRRRDTHGRLLDDTRERKPLIVSSHAPEGQSPAAAIEFLVTPTGSAAGNHLQGNWLVKNDCGLKGPTAGNTLVHNEFRWNAADSCS